MSQNTQDAGQSSPRPFLAPAQVTLLSTLVSGLMVSAAFYPLEVLELRSHIAKAGTDRQSWKLMWQECRQNVAKHGVKTLYRGFTPAAIQGTGGWMLYYTLFDWMRREYQLHNGVSAAAAGVIGTIANNPLQTIKMQMVAPVANGVPVTFFQSIRLVGCPNPVSSPAFRIANFYKGFAPSLMGISEGAIQLALYEHWKKALSDPSEQSPQVYRMFLAAAAARTTACLATYPLQLIRSRMQIGYSTSMLQTVQHSVREGGVPALYRGVSLNLARTVVPSAALYSLNDTIHHWLERLNKRI